MKFEIKLPAIAGDTVPLFLIADAMARRDATAGGTDFHERAYKGRLARYESMLLKHVRTGHLPTCDDDGDAGESAAIVQQRVARGAVRVLREVKATPARKGRAKASVSSAHQSLDGPAIDDDQTWLFNLFVKLKVLNEWASGRGDEFAVTHDGVSWIDERGMMPVATMVVLPEKSDPQRRLDALRALGGSIKQLKGHWAITGIGKLVAKEKADGTKRRSEKTIRRDLTEAAEAEKREGQTPPPPSKFPT